MTSRVTLGRLTVRARALRAVTTGVGSASTSTSIASSPSTLGVGASLGRGGRPGPRFPGGRLPTGRPAPRRGLEMTSGWGGASARADWEVEATDVPRPADPVVSSSTCMGVSGGGNIGSTSMPFGLGWFGGIDEHPGHAQLPEGVSVMGGFRQYVCHPNNWSAHFVALGS